MNLQKINNNLKKIKFDLEREEKQRLRQQQIDEERALLEYEKEKSLRDQEL